MIMITCWSTRWERIKVVLSANWELFTLFFYSSYHIWTKVWLLSFPASWFWLYLKPTKNVSEADIHTFRSLYGHHHRSRVCVYSFLQSDKSTDTIWHDNLKNCLHFLGERGWGEFSFSKPPYLYANASIDNYIGYKKR